MKKLTRKVLKTGFGLGLLTLAEAKKVATKVKKDLNLDEKESLRLANELMTASKKASREVMSIAHKHFKKAVVKSKAKKKMTVLKKLMKKPKKRKKLVPKVKLPKKKYIKKVVKKKVKKIMKKRKKK